MLDRFCTQGWNFSLKDGTRYLIPWCKSWNWVNGNCDNSVSGSTSFKERFRTSGGGKSFLPDVLNLLFDHAITALGYEWNENNAQWFWDHHCLRIHCSRASSKAEIRGTNAEREKFVTLAVTKKRRGCGNIGKRKAQNDRLVALLFLWLSLKTWSRMMNANHASTQAPTRSDSPTLNRSDKRLH